MGVKAGGTNLKGENYRKSTAVRARETYRGGDRGAANVEIQILTATVNKQASRPQIMEKTQG